MLTGLSSATNKVISIIMFHLRTAMMVMLKVIRAHV